jgi:Na+-transporting NADH:ubiquinone oxidoreductase subunit NqrE
MPPSPPIAPGRGLYLGPLRITLPVVLVTLALLGSAAFLLYVTFRVEDEQIPLLAAGFGVMGACFAAIAIGTLVEMWRAASRARAGRALGLAIVGGIAGLIAIGCFTFTALATMVWNT